MKFKLDTEIPTFEKKISHNKGLIFYGSCFSDELSRHFQNAGFSVCANPFGTIFHPLALAENLTRVLAKNEEDFRIFEANSSFYSWSCSNLISASSENELKEKLVQISKDLEQKIAESSHFFITFGTSFAYYLKENDEVVANCHKQNSNLFEKKLSAVEQMVTVWKDLLSQIYALNPAIEIVFTVSPVRHSKDGLIENNRSKARLFELISALEQHFSTNYFPSYEIVIDELRDYRFFTKDLVHPNFLAIDFLWEIVKKSFFEPKTLELCEKGEKLRLLDQHKILHTNEKISENFLVEKQNKISRFLLENPDFRW
jgi:lysophospholipase L1-like esterase